MTTAPLVLGILTPHQAPGPEVELPAMTDGRVTTVVSRTGPALRASTGPAALDRAAETFRGTPIAAVAHASTTTGYVLGPGDEADLVQRLSDRFRVPAVAACSAAVAALRTHGAARLQLVHPPWFDVELDRIGAAYFRDQGFDTVVTKAVDLAADPAGIDPEQVVDWVTQHLDGDADALYLAGTGFRTAAAVEHLEQRTGRLVVTANQALLWAALAATRTSGNLSAQGRLLRTQPS